MAALFFFILGLMARDLGSLLYKKVTFEKEVRDQEAFNDQLNKWHEATEGAAVRFGIMAPCLVKDTFNVADGREVSCQQFTDKIKSGEITF